MGWNDHTYYAGHRQWGLAEAGESSGDLSAVVEGLVEVTRWSTKSAECLCPTCQRKDGILFLDRRFPWVFCFKTPCADGNSAVNARLKERTQEIFGERGLLPAELTPEEEAESEERKRLWKIEVAARNRLLPQLLSLPPVTAEQWLQESPYPLAKVPVKDQWRLFIAGMFQQPQYHFQAGLIWVGWPWDTSGPQHVVNFKTRNDWLAGAAPARPQVSTCTFKAAGESKREYVETHDFFIVESDAIDREKFGNVVRWIQRYAKLRAVVDTGGKSRHGWFDRPAPPREQAHLVGDPPKHPDRDTQYALFLKWKRTYDLALGRDRRTKERFARQRDELFATLRGLGCDRNMFASLTARLPGVERCNDDGELTGRWQRLLYFDPPYEPR